jgi:assimilatory nitrate reductase catalytic subunit
VPRAGEDLAAGVQGARGLPSSRTATHCPYCSLQCAMEIVQERDGRLAVEASAFPTNRGTMCQKGWTSAELLRRPDRLTTPLVRDRRDAELRPASWDEALDRVAGELRACAGRHGHR